MAGWGLHPAAVDVSLIPSLSRPGHRWQVGTKNIVPPPPHISTVVTDSVHLLLLTSLRCSEFAQSSVLQRNIWIKDKDVETSVKRCICQSYAREHVLAFAVKYSR